MGEFVATLLTILKVEDGLNSELSDFIRVRAAIENRELKNDDVVAVFNIQGTTSYQVFFLDDDTTVEEIKEKLKKISVRLNYDSEEVLKRYINARRGKNERC
ncbi:DUF749 domain-containing protein [Methanotorris igneus]|uniref:DUF749 domain-containing protein n=1 Tax=Methanotorris igneus (strain DSM 5666 / JCM 11834 / Kol 5) TaxID=880724 RepID=F6BEB8_METIK|nr:DUF749 domain-containing protein [Methanotorris igneus]AEF96795.1 protein of unknown function DUF749 [Methanotorris igneus Kol 5]